MTYAIGMRTMPRPQDYCKQTLMRLVETGTLQDRRVKGLHVSDGRGLTPNQNGCRALRLAASDEPEWVIFMEDDVDIIDDFIGSVDRWLERFAVSDVLFYPLGCFYIDAVRDARDVGYWPMPVDKYYGSQAFVMRTPDALAYAEWLIGLKKAPEDDVSFDIHLQRWHKIVRPHQPVVHTPAPCFIDHTGEYSLMGPPGSWARVGRVLGFAGRDWSFT